MNPFRQGDILFVPVARETTRPDPGQKDLWKVRKRVRGEGLIVASGEATGHHHRAGHPSARLVEKGDKLYLRVPKGGLALTHEEHDDLELPQGDYEVIRQREYVAPQRGASTSSRGSSRQVWD